MKYNVCGVLENFLEMLSAERNVATNTLIAYKNDLQHFVNFLDQNNIELCQCDRNTLHSYIIDLSQQHLVGKSIRRKISALRQFFQFLLEEGLMQANIALELELPKKEISLPKALLQEDIVKLIDLAYRDQSHEGIRLSTMLEILYSTGMRISELVTLKMQYLQRTSTSIEPFLIIKGKGSKERLVILNDKALLILTQYLTIRKLLIKKNTNTDWLFPSYTKEQNITHISRQRFGQLLKSLAIEAGVDHTKVSPHKIRHSFASHLLENGANLRVVQELLGHSDISSTQIYTRVLNSNLKKLVFAKHPLAF